MEETTVLKMISAIVFTGIFRATALHSNDVKFEDWKIGPFKKESSLNPILSGTNVSEFMCPITEKLEHWESGGVLNPSAVVKDGKVYLIYRALSTETTEHNKNVTSRLGLATSYDGFRFTRDAGEPILYPTTESPEENEWYAGCEDPRVVKREDETYVMIYIGNNGSDFAMKVATSLDLKTWTKKGFAFEGTEFREYEFRSASVVTKFYGGEFIAATINDYYWMYFWYWENNGVYSAKSTDLITWSPVTDENGMLLKVFEPRFGFFDSEHVEPGPQAIIRTEGILLMYSSRDMMIEGSHGGSYSAGQAIFALNDPTKLEFQTDLPFLTADKEYETDPYGVKLISLSGLVCFQGQWILYYGAGDHKIAVATNQDKYCKEDVDTTTPGGVGSLRDYNMATKIAVTTIPFYFFPL